MKQNTEMLPLMRKTKSQGITVVEKRNSKLVWLANRTDYARDKSVCWDL